MSGQRKQKVNSMRIIGIVMVFAALIVFAAPIGVAFGSIMALFSGLPDFLQPSPERLGIRAAKLSANYRGPDPFVVIGALVLGVLSTAVIGFIVLLFLVNF